MRKFALSCLATLAMASGAFADGILPGIEINGGGHDGDTTNVRIVRERSTDAEADLSFPANMPVGALDLEAKWNRPADRHKRNDRRLDRKDHSQDGWIHIDRTTTFTFLENGGGILAAVKYALPGTGWTGTLKLMSGTQVIWEKTVMTSEDKQVKMIIPIVVTITPPVVDPPVNDYPGFKGIILENWSSTPLTSTAISDFLQANDTNGVYAGGAEQTFRFNVEVGYQQAGNVVPPVPGSWQPQVFRKDGKVFVPQEGGVSAKLAYDGGNLIVIRVFDTDFHPKSLGRITIVIRSEQID